MFFKWSQPKMFGKWLTVWTHPPVDRYCQCPKHHLHYLNFLKNQEKYQIMTFLFIIFKKFKINAANQTTLALQIRRVLFIFIQNLSHLNWINSDCIIKLLSKSLPPILLFSDFESIKSNMFSLHLLSFTCSEFSYSDLQQRQNQT